MAEILLVQLSDIHFKETGGGTPGMAKKISGAIQEQLPRADVVLLVVTGDIANSGKSDEYKHAIQLIEELKSDIESRHGKPLRVLTVPGNHDADFSSPKGKARVRILKQLGANAITTIDDDDLDDCTLIFEEYEKFRALVETVNTTKLSPIWRTGSIEVGEEVIVLHCVNNAWNCEIQTSPGSLGFPLHLHQSIPEKSCSLRILLMHHPAHWIQSRQYRDFRRLSRECAELCLTGHEHVANSGTNHDSETGLRLYIEGGVLNDPSHPGESSFNASLLDLRARSIETTHYELSHDIYRKSEDPFIQTLPEPYRLVPLQPQWLDFIHDIGSNVKHHSKERLELSDLYVYPELELTNDDEEDSNPTISASQLANDLGKGALPILVKGEQTSGKTALLKKLYVEAIEKGFFPIYINGMRLKSSSERDLQKLIEHAIEEQYAPQTVTAVRQAHPDKRILLLDNIDRYGFPDRYMAAVIDFLERGFGQIIATAEPTFDLKEVVLADELSSLRKFEQMRILEISFRLRFDLVRKWCNLAVRQDGSPELDVEHTDRLVSKIVGRGLVPAHPIYVLVILQVIEVGREGELENSALGHYYEYMILCALEPKIRQEHVHEILNYCSHLAWFLQNQKTERLSDGELRRFHQAFEDKFDLEISYDARKKLLESANICLDLGGRFGFRYPYIYYFFLGRYLAARLQDSEVQQFVKRCCQNLHVREHANAILFLAHHSADPFVFKQLQEAVDSKFPLTATLKFQGDTERLDKLVDTAPVLVYDEALRTERRHEAQSEDHRIELHLDSVSNDKKKELHEAETQQSLQLVSDINGLMKGIEILGTALKANFGTIEAGQKQELVAAIFNGGLRGLRVFVELFSDIPDYIMGELAAVLEDSAEATNEEKERAIKIRVFHVISRFSFWFVRRIGTSIGSKSMAPAVERYVQSNDTIANQLIAMAGALETPGRIPFKELQAINERVFKAPFALSILRLIAFTRMHMYKTLEAEKQQVCSELGIRMATQRAIEYRTKDSKKITKV